MFVCKTSGKSSLQKKDLARKGAVILFVLYMFNGKFTLSRIDSSFSEIGIFEDARIWLGLAFLTVYLLALTGKSKSGKQKTVVFSVVWLTWVFFCYMIASALWSTSSLIYDEVFSLVLLSVMILLCVPLFNDENGENRELALKLTFWIALVYAIAGLYTSIFAGHSGRVAVFGGGPNVFVRVVSTGIIIALFMAISTKKNHWLVGIPLFFVALILSGSRGGVFAFFAIVPIYSFFLFRLGKLKTKQLTLFIVMTGLTMLVFVQVEKWWLFFQERFITLTFEEKYFSSRDILIEQSWQLFIERPIGGIGLGGFAYNTGYAYPHNIVLQVILEGGLVGFIFFVFIIGMTVFQQRKRTNILQSTCFCLGGYYFFASMFSGGLYDTRWMWVFFLFSVFPINQQKEQDENHIHTPIFRSS